MINSIFTFIKDPIIFVPAIKVLFIKISAIIFIFLMNLLVVREVGITESGLFFLSMGIVIFIANISKLGLDQPLTKFISKINSSKRKENIHAVHKKAITWSLTSSFLAASGIFILSPLICEVIFAKPELTSILKIMSFSIIPIVNIALYSHSLQGLKKPKIAMIILSLIIPVLIVLIILMLDMRDAKDISIAYLTVNLITFLLSVIAWEVLSIKRVSTLPFSGKKLWESSSPLWLSIFFHQIMIWSPLLILGVWSSSEDIAIFNISNRIAGLVLVLMFALNSIVAPELADAKSKNDIDQIIQISKTAIKISLFGGIPILMSIFIFPEFLLGLFGNEFKSATTILIVLSLGTMANIFTGPVSTVLAMTDNEKEVLWQNVFGGLVTLIFALMLIPYLQIMGAAVSASLGLASRNLFGVYQVYFLYKENILFFWRD